MIPVLKKKGDLHQKRLLRRQTNARCNLLSGDFSTLGGGRSPGEAASEELFLRNARCKQMQSLWIFAHTSEGEPLFHIVSRDVFQENAASDCVL
jgi:hypothetical protein